MNKQILSETRFLYNENQQLVLTEKLNSEGEILYRKATDYDDKNRISNVNIIDNISLPSYIKSMDYYYGEPNNDKTISIVESIETKEDGIDNVINRLIEVDYDVDSLIERTTVNGDVYKLSTHDTNDNIIYEREIDNDEITDKYYIYNNYNKLIKKISNDEIIEENEYNEIGLCIKTLTRNDSGFTTITNYKYDEQNRVIEELIVKNNDIQLITNKYFKSTQIKSYYTVDENGVKHHEYDDVIMVQGDNKRLYITPDNTTEEEYDSYNNITKILVYKPIPESK